MLKVNVLSEQKTWSMATFKTADNGIAHLLVKTWTRMNIGIQST